MSYIIIGIIFTIIGYLYLRLVHGKRHKKAVEKEYDGSYEDAGKELFVNVFSLLFVVLIGVFWLLMMGSILWGAIKSLFGIE